MHNFEDLLAQFSGNNCGDNLEYSPQFLELEQLVQGKPEQQFGDTIIQAQAPEWSQAEKIALALCEKTCDIRVLAVLTWAWTAQQGLPGYARGLALIDHVISEYWDTVHPLLVEDGFEDPMPRMNALLALGDMQGVGKSLRSASLLSGVHGQLSLRDAELVLDGTRSDEFPGGRSRLCEVLSQAKLSEQDTVMAVLQAGNSLRHISELLSEKLGYEWIPDYKEIRHILDTVTSVLGSGLDGLGESEAPLESEATPSDTNTAKVETATVVYNWRDVQIKTRADAMLALEKAISYFETFEPSHPAPFLLRRVQQTIPLNFYEILQNLTPSGADQFDNWMPKD